MSETPDASSEVQQSSPESGGSSRTDIGIIKTLEHDSRGHLATVANVLQIIESGVPPESVGPVIAIGRRGIGHLGEMLREAAEREPFPEIPLEEVYEMTIQTVHELCADPDLIKKHPRGCAAIQSLDDAQIDLSCPESPMHIFLQQLPAELNRYLIPLSSNALRRILGNLIENSLKKGARIMRITFEKTDIHDILLSVSDNGEGMKRKILDALRAGKGDTDKTKDDITPGRTVEDHGRGIRAVRHMIEGKCRGSMKIYSVMKTVLDDSDTESDPGSMEHHPFPHGVTFQFLLPVNSMQINGDHAETSSPTSIPQRQLYARRQLLRWSLGSAAALTLFAYLSSINKHESSDAQHEHLPQSPLSNIAIDDAGGIASFTIRIAGQEAVYERGRPLPDLLHDVRVAPTTNGSVMALRPAAVDGMKPRQMFLCVTPQGIFGQVDVPVDDSKQYSFLLMPRENKADIIHPTETSLYFQTDILFNPIPDSSVADGVKTEKYLFDTTAMDVLRSPLFAAMQPSLDAIANRLKRQSIVSKGGASLNTIRPLLISMLTARNAVMNRGVLAKSRDELVQLLSEERRCIIAGPDAVESLKREALSAESVQLAMKRQNNLCLPGVSETQARAMILL